MDARDVFADLVVQGKLLSGAKGSDAKLIGRLRSIYGDTSKLESELQEKTREVQDLRRQLASKAQTGLVCLEVLYDEHGSSPVVVKAIEAAIAEVKGKNPLPLPEKPEEPPKRSRKR